MSKKRSLILQCVIGGLTGVFGTLFLYYVLDAKGQDGFQDVDSTVVLMMLWPVIVWHELGHAISGWLVGFRLYLLAAGPLRVERVGGRLKWGFNRSVGMWGGVAASMPDASNIDGRLRVKVLRMVAGGPVASLAGGLLAVTAAMLWTESPNGSAAFTTFAVLSVLIGVLTLFPISNYGFVNDGQRILQLWRQGAAGMR